jgi:hypothetical protein
VTQLLILLLIALPPLLIGILIWGWVRETDAERHNRGFEVKLNPGLPPGVKRKEDDHG